MYSRTYNHRPSAHGRAPIPPRGDDIVAMHPATARPGPKRPRGKPSGPDEVRRAVLAAAASLYASYGVDGVSLRQIAAAADVNPALISRYIGSKEQLQGEVFAYASAELEKSLREHPLERQGITPDTPMGQWVRITASMAIAGHPIHSTDEANPVQVMAEILVRAYGVSEGAARLRAAQIAAAALGWRIFEDYLIEAAQLGDTPVEVLREELTRSARRLGATEWPSPPDPVPLDRDS